jgi:hypothetical protein
MNILFFSNNCDSSKALINLMQQENLLRFFNLQCTDQNKNIPPQIKVTPTIIIKGIPIPYAAGDAFVWLTKIKQWKMNVQLQKMSETQQKYFQNQNNNNFSGPKLLEFSREEMDGMSDMFSYLQEQEGNIPHSYVAYDKIGQDNICTPPKETIKINAENCRKMRSNLESERRKQDETFKQQLNHFLNNGSKK